MKKKIATSAITLAAAVVLALGSSIPASAITTQSLGGRNCGSTGGAHSGVTSITKGTVTEVANANAWVGTSKTWAGVGVWKERSLYTTYFVTSSNYVTATSIYLASTTCTVQI